MAGFGQDRAHSGAPLGNDEELRRQLEWERARANKAEREAERERAARIKAEQNLFHYSLHYQQAQEEEQSASRQRARHRWWGSAVAPIAVAGLWTRRHAGALTAVAACSAALMIPPQPDMAPRPLPQVPESRPIPHGAATPSAPSTQRLATETEQGQPPQRNRAEDEPEADETVEGNSQDMPASEPPRQPAEPNRSEPTPTVQPTQEPTSPPRPSSPEGGRSDDQKDGSDEKGPDEGDGDHDRGGGNNDREDGDDHDEGRGDEDPDNPRYKDCLTEVDKILKVCVS